MIFAVSHGLSQTKPRPSRGQGVWLWPEKYEAKAKESQAKAMVSGQSQASTSLRGTNRSHEDNVQVGQVGMLQCIILYDSLNANSVPYYMGSPNSVNQ